jgi:hypothetical protein
MRGSLLGPVVFADVEAIPCDGHPLRPLYLVRKNQDVLDDQCDEVGAQFPRYVPVALRETVQVVRVAWIVAVRNAAAVVELGRGSERPSGRGRRRRWR